MQERILKVSWDNRLISPLNANDKPALEVKTDSDGRKRLKFAKIPSYIKNKRKPDKSLTSFLYAIVGRSSGKFFILNKGAINEKLQSVSPAVNGRENNIKIKKTGG